VDFSFLEVAFKGIYLYIAKYLRRGDSIMAIIEEKIKIKNIPALITHPGDKSKKARGTILFYHGLKSYKETNRKEFKSLAERGYISVGIDAVGHGERIYPDFDRRISSTLFNDTFFKIINDTVEEIPVIIDFLLEKGISEQDKIGVAGISMGGYITYASALVEPRINVLAPILGSPEWKSRAGSPPSKHPEKFFPRAILIQNAGKDESVLPRYSREFHETLKSYYAKAPERLKYVEFPDSGHFMKEEDWNVLWDNVLNWFDGFFLNKQ
jgi:uncharacterized protein